MTKIIGGIGKGSSTRLGQDLETNNDNNFSTQQISLSSDGSILAIARILMVVEWCYL